jgi:hypothetical protein
MPAFESDPRDNSRPFVRTNVTGDVTKQSAMSSMAEQGGRGNMRSLVKTLAKKAKDKRKDQQAAIKYARTGEAAKKRGEMGMNPSGTQGARGTEAKYMNPAVYGKRAK